MAWKVVLFVTILIYKFLSKQNTAIGETIFDVEKLLAEKFSPDVYNKRIRGQLDLSVTMDISLSFELLTIMKLDDLQESLQVLGVLILEWSDERLIWDPQAYNGTHQVYVPAEDVWKPEIMVANPSSTVGFLGDEISRMVTQHYYSGTAKLTIGEVFSCSCSVDLTAFPWDEQNCTLVLVILAYLKNEIQFVAKQEHAGLAQYQSNGQWILLGTRMFAFEVQNKSYLAIEIRVKRRSTFFVVNILLPVVTLSALNLLVFLVPVESGERVSFSLTVLLSIGVFITLISESLPPSAESMASICYLLSFVLVKSTVVCFFNIISMKIYFKSDEQVEVNKILKYFMCKDKRLFCRKKPFHVEGLGVAKGKVEAEEGDNASFDASDRITTQITWKDISRLLDKIFFIFFALLLVMTYSIFSYHVLIKK